MPSIEIEVALVVFQVSCTASPALTTEGVAVICAVGWPIAALGADSPSGGAAGFFLQPEIAAREISKTAIRKRGFRSFKGVLLPKIVKSNLLGNRCFVSQIPPAPPDRSYPSPHP
jgi:hypothetical protein